MSMTPNTDPSLGLSWWGQLARLGRLIRKELNEILRDRRTVLTLVLMPLLLYPILGMAFRHYLVLSGVPEADVPGYRLGFRTPREQVLFESLLHRGNDLFLVQEMERGNKFALTDQTLNLDKSQIVPDLDRALRKNEIDLGVIIKNAEAFPLPLAHTLRQPIDRLLECELIYLQNAQRSLEALDYVSRRLAAGQTYDLRQRMNIPDIQRPVVAFDIVRRVVEPDRRAMAQSLAPIIPLILILMTITGAVYPAIDLTAGERERGTLEILVAAPVPRLGLLVAKYVSVLTVAVLTAVVNLTAMMITLQASGLTGLLLGEQGLTLLRLVQILALLLLFAGFFSAVLLTITSFARSFKEAQAYLIPLMLISLAPGVAGLLPGLQLTLTVAVIPLLNIVLLGRDLFAGQADFFLALVVVFSTLLYAAAAVAGAARIFGAESVLYSEQNSWSELLRRPRQPRPEPTLTGALFCLALTIPGVVLVQGLAAQFVPLLQFLGMAEPRERSFIFYGHISVTIVGSVLLYLGLPLLAAWWRRIQVVPAFRLTLPRWLAWPGTLLLGLSLWPFVIALLALMQQQGWTTLSTERQEQLLAQLRQLRRLLPQGLVVASVVIPAIVEELFFRGFLFSALRRVSGPALTIAISSLLFSLVHVFTLEVFALERVVPSLLMGLILGTVCWWTGSVWPGLLLHAVHNACLMLANYHAEGVQMVALVEEWWRLAIGGVVGGVVLMGLARQNEREPA